MRQNESINNTKDWISKTLELWESNWYLEYYKRNKHHKRKNKIEKIIKQLK